MGPKHISGDPHVMSPNGALLAGIIERHNLILGNGSTKCTGIITRRRETKQRVEQSVIDHVMFSDDLKEHFTSMHIDENRRHVLTKIRKTKEGIKVKESDHNVIISEFQCKVKPNEDKNVTEFYNLKDREGQIKFKEYTSEIGMLSNTIKDDDDINVTVKRFMKKLQGCIVGGGGNQGT